MSTFTPGTGGALVSTTKPAAFAEVARLLGAAEKTRNAANPGIPARNNVTISASIDGGTLDVAASIPITPTLDTTGSLKIAAQDYLGSAYTAFVPGTGGDLKSTNIVAAFLEMAEIVSGAEQAITPAENQPNNVQVEVSLEALTATITASIPITDSETATGAIQIAAVDYL